MTKDEAHARILRINRWRQRLVMQEFFYGGLQPWQEMQLRAYRDEMERLDPIAYPEMWAALEEREREVAELGRLADTIEAVSRYYTAAAEGTACDEADREIVETMLQEMGAET